jgi:hypothetical protein
MPQGKKPTGKKIGKTIADNIDREAGQVVAARHPHPANELARMGRAVDSLKVVQNRSFEAANRVNPKGAEHRILAQKGISAALKRADINSRASEYSTGADTAYPKKIK